MAKKKVCKVCGKELTFRTPNKDLLKGLRTIGRICDDCVKDIKLTCVSCGREFFPKVGCEKRDVHW